MPAWRMKPGVGASGSPTQNGSTSGLPRPSLTSSRIFEAPSARTAGRADNVVSLFISPSILDSEGMSKERWALAAALATMVAWGMNFVFVKYILEYIGVGAFMFLRFPGLPVL